MPALASGLSLCGRLRGSLPSLGFLPCKGPGAATQAVEGAPRRRVRQPQGPEPLSTRSPSDVPPTLPVSAPGKPMYLHIGEEVDGVDMRAEVGLLSRNLVIAGEMEAGCYPYTSHICSFFDFDTFGGHIKVGACPARPEPHPTPPETSQGAGLSTGGWRGRRGRRGAEAGEPSGGRRRLMC